MIVAVIPLKRLSDAKSRLSPRLNPDARARTAIDLLQNSVAALRECGRIARIALVTPEQELASRLDLELLPDRGTLNDSLSEGVRWAEAIAADALLILPADLPLLAGADIRALLESHASSPGITIARTHDGGTGALLLAPPDAIPPAFGQDSFEHHLRLAAERNLRVCVIEREAFARDLDTVHDLEDLPSSARRD